MLDETRDKLKCFPFMVTIVHYKFEADISKHDGKQI